MAGNIQEVRARGASVLAIALEDDANIEAVCDHCLRVPALPDAVQPIITILPLQLFAYYVAALRGNDVDKPRNLAKSVTVE
ncbi:Glutamine--fructose-6-phosphate aminotransferase [isomerizing] [bioreactor metagenome]|uniref:Glutamine--fructose-6-phosphate aminotransferase [isomerizing] n=1 Tax=bioreactor metagenome TaxID=1076179 RepID=A0A645DA36_9ZZZZ